MSHNTNEPTWDTYVTTKQRRKLDKPGPGELPKRGAASPIDARLYELGHQRMGGLNCEIDRLWLQGIGTQVRLRSTLPRDAKYAKRIFSRARMRDMVIRAWIDAEMSTVVEWIGELPCKDDRPIRFGIPAPGETIHIPKDTFTATKAHLSGPCLLMAEVAFWKARIPKGRAKLFFTVGSTEDALTITRPV